MEEQKSKRGGARKGAGRKKKLDDSQKQKKQIQMLFSDEEKEILYKGYEVWLSKHPYNKTFKQYLKGILLQQSQEFTSGIKIEYHDEQPKEKVCITIAGKKDITKADFYIFNGKVTRVTPKTNFKSISNLATFITVSDKTILDETISKFEKMESWQLSSRYSIINFLNNLENGDN